MRFERFAAQPFGREDLDRLTEEEELVLTTRRRVGVVAACERLHMSPSALHRRQRSIVEKLSE